MASVINMVDNYTGPGIVCKVHRAGGAELKPLSTSMRFFSLDFIIQFKESFLNRVLG